MKLKIAVYESAVNNNLKYTHKNIVEINGRADHKYKLQIGKYSNEASMVDDSPQPSSPLIFIP